MDEVDMFSIFGNHHYIRVQFTNDGIYKTMKNFSDARLVESKSSYLLKH